MNPADQDPHCFPSTQGIHINDEITQGMCAYLVEYSTLTCLLSQLHSLQRSALSKTILTIVSKIS